MLTPEIFTDLIDFLKKGREGTKIYTFGRYATAGYDEGDFVMWEWGDEPADLLYAGLYATCDGYDETLLINDQLAVIYIEEAGPNARVGDLDPSQVTRYATIEEFKLDRG